MTHQYMEIKIKELEKRIKALEQEPTYYPPCIDCNKKMDEIRRAYDKLKEQKPFATQEPKMGHWIPVSESLPSEDEDVMAWVESGDEARIACCNYAKEVWFDAIMDVIVSPIAWMPLPEPYAPDTNIGKMSEIPTDCSNLDSCENCKYDDGECCRLLYEAKMESKGSDVDNN